MGENEPVPYSFGGMETKIAGIRHWIDMTPAKMEMLRNMSVHDGDVFVCGYPKSGNVWMVTILRAIFAQNHLGIFEKYERFEFDSFLEGNTEKALKLPRPNIYIIHNYYHMLPREFYWRKPKMIYIVRNPKDVAVSYYYLHKIAIALGPWKGTWDVFFDAFMRGDVFFGNYFDHLDSFRPHRIDSNIFYVTYEALRRDPSRWIKDIAEFIGTPLNPEKLDKIVRLTDFDTMKKHPFNPTGCTTLTHGGEFMRSGKVGSWKQVFTKEQNKQIDVLIEKVEKKHSFRFDCG